MNGGDVQTLDGIGNGAECSVAETDSGHAHEVRILIDGAPSTTGEFIFGEETGQTIQISVVNTYETGSLAITKALIGESSVEQWTFAVTCEWEGRTATATVTATAVGTPTVLTGLPVGAICAVVEDDNGQDAVVYDIEGPYEIDEDGAQVEIVATNSYLGGLVVTKNVENHTLLTAAQIAGLRFEITTTCVYDEETVLEDTREYADGQSETFADLPVGSVCTVEETDAAGASSTTVQTVVSAGQQPETDAVEDPADGQVNGTSIDATIAEELTEVIVTNIYSPLSITVTKALSGSPTDADKAAVFTFAIGCSWTVGDEALTIDLSAVQGISGGSFTLTAGATFTVAGLPYPSDCTLVETGAGGADSTAYTVDGASAGTSSALIALDADSAGADGTVAVTVMNQFDETPAVLAAPPKGGSLPNTGAHASSELKVGLVVLALGVGLVLVARRRRDEA